jgi:hypothetical protein
VTRHHSCRVSPFGHPRIHARLTAPRGISQPPTSFIGSQCQGIHHAPLNTYNTKPKIESLIYKDEIFRNCTSDTKKPTPPPGRHAHIRCLDARNHYPQIKHHTPPPKMEQQHANPCRGATPTGDHNHLRFPLRDEEVTGLLSQSPIVCLAVPSPVFPHRLSVCRAPEPHPLQAWPIHRIAQITEPPHDVGGPGSRGAP